MARTLQRVSLNILNLQVGDDSPNMSDSHMFTKNKMPDGYDEVWKAFGRAWMKKDKDDEEQVNTK